MSALHEAVLLVLDGLTAPDRGWVMAQDARTFAAVLRTSWLSSQSTGHLHAAMMAATDEELHACTREAR